jgi:hypothetical protein
MLKHLHIRANGKVGGPFAWEQIRRGAQVKAKTGGMAVLIAPALAGATSAAMMFSILSYTSTVHANMMAIQDPVNEDGAEAKAV